MPDQLPSGDPRTVWRNQAQEKFEVNMQQFLNRRAQELSSKTRSEIITSLVAVCSFLAVIVWRFSFPTEPGEQMLIGLIVAWILVSLYMFRDRIRVLVRPPTDAAAATGLDYYRHELERRRDHLGNAWLWHGPMLLACLVLLWTIAGKAWPSPHLLKNTLPFVIFLGVWIALGIYLRRRQRKEIQREIEEVELLRK